jgi:hypothetical protein
VDNDRAAQGKRQPFVDGISGEMGCADDQQSDKGAQVEQQSGYILF